MDAEYSKPNENTNGAPRTTEPKADPLAQVENLDIEEGLHYVAENRNLYETLLKAFIANNCNAIADIRTALSAQDMTTAQRIAHSLKGLAATIGARKLQQAAKAVETAIENNQPDAICKKLQVLEELIDPLIQQIRLALESEGN